MKKFIGVLLCCLILCACLDVPQPNQKVRREVFNECLERAPKDPKLLNGSSWKDVVNECGNQAYSISIAYDALSKRN